jgi:hypothetical protein
MQIYVAYVKKQIEGSLYFCQFLQASLYRASLYRASLYRYLLADESHVNGREWIIADVIIRSVDRVGKLAVGSS